MDTNIQEIVDAENGSSSSERHSNSAEVATQPALQNTDSSDLDQAKTARNWAFAGFSGSLVITILSYALASHFFILKAISGFPLVTICALSLLLTIVSSVNFILKNNNFNKNKSKHNQDCDIEGQGISASIVLGGSQISQGNNKENALIDDALDRVLSETTDEVFKEAIELEDARKCKEEIKAIELEDARRRKEEIKAIELEDARRRKEEIKAIELEDARKCKEEIKGFILQDFNYQDNSSYLRDLDKEELLQRYAELFPNATIKIIEQALAEFQEEDRENYQLELCRQKFQGFDPDIGFVSPQKKETSLGEEDHITISSQPQASFGRFSDDKKATETSSLGFRLGSVGEQSESKTGPSL